jgi:hypothetical protein
MRRLFLVAALISSLPRASGAECVNVKITTREALESSDIVFSGTVTKVEDPHAPGLTQLLTFVVDQIWKGSAAKEQLIYHQISAESRVFRTGEKLVVFARLLTAADRERVGLPREGAPVFGYRSFDCPAAPIDVYGGLARLPSVKPQ